MEILTNLKSKKVILASKSPRRQQLIIGLGIDVEIRTKEVEESFSEALIRQEVAMYLAEKKAKAFEGELATDEILITGDTIVCLNDLILNKPEGTEDAKRMLRLLSGKTHNVITGVCIADNNRKELFYDSTEVTFGELTDAEIAYYIENHKPFDKAGSYGAQDFIGFIGIQGMNGSYYNVMGFPLHKVYEVLKTW